MRVFYLITKSEVGGAQTHVFQLIRFMKSRGNEVALMSFPGGWLEKAAKEQGAIFYANEFLSNGFDVFKGARALRAIQKAVVDFRADLVSYHSTGAGFWGRLAVRNRVPTIFTAHGWGFTPGVPWRRRLVALAAERLASRYCTRIICVSRFDQVLALRFGVVPARKTTVIHNGAEQAASRGTAIFEGGARIAFVGRLAEPKDPLLFLRAFFSLPPEPRGKAEIRIIGEGEKRGALEQYIQDQEGRGKVALLGELDRKEVLERLLESDILVLTSKWEGLPLSILEAMRYGLPVIASDVGGVSEAVGPQNGILVKRGDVAGLREALRFLIEHPEARRSMGEAGRKRVEEQFSLARMLEETERVYREVLG